jgi:hypothetical protein
MEFPRLCFVLFHGWRAAALRRVHYGERTMIRISTLALAIAIVAPIAPAAMAQTGGSPAVAAHKAKMPNKEPKFESRRPLYNMAPGNAPVLGRDDPAGTGGGSIGYNKMLYNW